MKRESLIVATLVCAAGLLSAQTVNVTLLEKKRTATAYPSRSTEPSHGRALPLPGAAPSAPRTYTVTGASLRLQLPDGRIIEAVCTDKMPDQPATQPHQRCLTPTDGPIQAKFKGPNVKLTWRIANTKRSEVYSVLHLPLSAAYPPHR